MGKPSQKATAGEFRWIDGITLQHMPTGARFACAGKTSQPSIIDAGLLGIPLGDGADYDIESVLDLAWRLVEMRFNKVR